MDRSSTPAPLTVAQLAGRFGVTVRTLHHYDRIGLVVPNVRNDAGWRLYDELDAERLRAVLVWRRLGLSLEEVGRMVDAEPSDRREVLRRQRSRIAERIEELQELAAAIDDALEYDEGPNMEHDTRIVDALDGFDPDEHADEARERWGDTDAWRESRRRARDYTPEDWRRIRGETTGIDDELRTLWSAGVDATSEDAIAVAERWRLHVERNFHECPPEHLRSMGDMYVADPRFTAYYDGPDGERAGMAGWVRDAWHARADRG